MLGHEKSIMTTHWQSSAGAVFGVAVEETGTHRRWSAAIAAMRMRGSAQTTYLGNPTGLGEAGGARHRQRAGPGGGDWRRHRGQETSGKHLGGTWWWSRLSRGRGGTDEAERGTLRAGRQG